MVWTVNEYRVARSMFDHELNWSQSRGHELPRTSSLGVMVEVPSLLWQLDEIALPVLIITIAILDSTKVFRLARSVAVNIVSLEFVEAARLRGEGWWWIVKREVLPNAIPPLTAEFGLRFCFTFLFIAALSFLGLGVQPPDADWGSMVRDYRDMINFGSAAPLYPAAAIAILTIGVNFVVDWMLSMHSRGQGEGA